MSAFEGYLTFGGNEIVNNSRVRGIAATASCPMGWFTGPECDTLADALGQVGDYNSGQIELAPWYDDTRPDVSARFFGFYATSYTEVLDSTRTVSGIEGIDDGGTLGRTRKAMKTARVQGLLVGQGRDAIEYGQFWLSAALDPDACGQHSLQCGLTDLAWFSDCPPVRAQVPIDPSDPSAGSRPQTDAEYAVVVDGYIRYLHGVAAISGPLIGGTFNSGEFWAYQVEVVFEAERPWVYGKTHPLNLPPTTPVVVQDIPFNLVKYPSAELADAAAVIVATNYSTNPSVETNNTGWAVGADGVAILAAQVVGSRSTELAAVGAASQKALWTAAGAGATAGSFYAQQEVTLAHAVVAGERFSINMWAAANIQAGAPVMGVLDVHALWRAAGATVRDDTIGTVTGGAGVTTKRGIAPPVGATSVIVRATQRVTSWPAGAIVRLYADALAVTVP